MTGDDTESKLRDWFRQPLPAEPDSLHHLLGSLPAAEVRETVRHRVPLSRWARVATVCAAAALVAAVVGGSALIAMNRPQAASTRPTANPGRFITTGPTFGQGWDTATVLEDGSVLITGGGDPASSQPWVLAELYDPSSGQFRATGSMTSQPGLTGGRRGPTATLLADGRVLVAGGRDESGLALATAEVYDPKRGTFSQTGSMTVARATNTATLLSDGKVLMVGGRTGPDTYGTGSGSPSLLASAELYDPVTGSFSAAGSMAEPRADSTATLMKDGRILVAGGSSDRQLASAEIYDPTSGKFTPTGSLLVARQGPTATLLRDGRILVTGGWGTDGSLSSAELYSPESATFSATGSMTDRRYQQTANLMPSGLVLVAGGECGGFAENCPLTSGATTSAELYDPHTGLFSPAGPMTEPRYGHVSALLQNGTVLLVGGEDAKGMLSSADLYQP